jgi:hypothetical protein
MNDRSLLAKTAVQSEFAPHKYPALLCEKKLQHPAVNILSHGSGFLHLSKGHNVEGFIH